MLQISLISLDISYFVRVFQVSDFSEFFRASFRAKFMLANNFFSFSFPKENLTGKPKGCFPTFVDGIHSKPVGVD